MTNGRLPIRSIAILFLAGLCGGCATLFQPYLNSSPLNQASSCDPAKEKSDCSAVGRFKAVRAGVAAMQQQAQDSYIERAKLNTISSALAFPVVGVLLYRGATVNTDNGRNAVLKGALAAGAAYETRNALLSGSPESIYILSEARLACVLDEAAKYRLDLPAGQEKQDCDDKARTLGSQATKLLGVTEIDVKYVAPRNDLVSQVSTAVSQYSTSYNTAEVLFASAADKMQATARKIVSDTNAQIHTPSISPATATALMKSEMALFAPASPVSPDGTTGGAKSAAGKPVNIVDQINNLTIDLNNFTRSCLRPQPASVSAFDSCTTYSPAVPALSNISIDLPNNQKTLNPGDSRTIKATSSPSGTPWGSFVGNADVVQKSLGQFQQLTLSPTQSQITLTYDKANPVTTDTQVVLSYNTLSVPGNATTITLTLKANPPAPSPAPGAAGKSVFASVTSDTTLMTKLGLSGGADDNAVRGNLQNNWRKTCAAPAAIPIDAQLIVPAFLNAVKAGSKPDATQAFCQ